MNFDAKTIAEQLAICEAATEGPWEYQGIPGATMSIIGNKQHVVAGIPNINESSVLDGACIVESRNHYPAALREIRVLERALELACSDKYTCSAVGSPDDYRAEARKGGDDV